MPLWNTQYDGKVKYFVLYVTYDDYDTTTGVERLTEEVREYIDNHFPWVDGYKPKENVIQTEIIPLAE